MTTHRSTGPLLLTAVTAMVASAVLVVPSGLTLNPADPAGVLAAVRERTALHLLELALDVLGWLALTIAGLTLRDAVRPTLRDAASPARRDTVRPTLRGTAGGLLAAAGLAGLLHDAGNLAVTQLAADRAAIDPASAAAVAWGVLLTAKWMVNLAGLLWTSATVAAALTVPGRRCWTGLAAAASGLAAVVLPWTTGTAGPGAAVEQAGYLLHLPVMIWFTVFGLRKSNARGIGSGQV